MVEQVTCAVCGSPDITVTLYPAAGGATAYCAQDWKELWTPKGAP